MNTTTNHLDSLVRNLSAFGSWNELVHSMSSNGYVPTLHPTNEEAIELRSAIENAGFRVFPYSDRIRPGRPIEIDPPIVVDEPCECHLPETEMREDDEIKIHFTYVQMDYAEDYLFPSVEHEIASSAKTFIVAPRSVWKEVLSIAYQMDFEMMQGFGSLELDTPNKFNFAVRAFDRMQSSLCERIERALGKGC